jgi:hypothetical protein
MQILDEIFQASKLGYSAKANSIVSTLLDAKWCTECDLERAYDWLDEQINPSAVAYFQLPFPVLLPEEDIKYSASEIDIPEPLLKFICIGTDLNVIDSKQPFQTKARTSYKDHDKYVNAYLKNDRIGNINKTQVIVKFRLWRFWQNYFQQYSDTVFIQENINTVLIKTPITNSRRHLVDDEGVTITAAKFEYDLAKRLRLESINIINSFLEIYSVACRHSLPYRHSVLTNFFIMVKGGRVITLGPGPSMVSSAVEALPIHKQTENLKSLNNYLLSGRKVSIYEQYLLNAVNLVQNGSTNLAIVYVSMILEWFANEIIDDNFKRALSKTTDNKKMIDLCVKGMWRESDKKGAKVSVKDRFTRYFPAIGLNIPPKMLDEISEIINRRNTIVHGDQTNNADQKYALSAIDKAMNFINFIMNQLIKKTI